MTKLKFYDLLEGLYQGIGDLIRENQKQKDVPELKSIFIQLIVDTCRSGELINILQEDSGDHPNYFKKKKRFTEKFLEFHRDHHVETYI